MGRSGIAVEQAGADFFTQADELLLFLRAQAFGKAGFHLTDAAAYPLMELDGIGGQLQFFQAGIPVHRTAGDQPVFLHQL